MWISMVKLQGPEFFFLGYIFFIHTNGFGLCPACCRCCICFIYFVLFSFTFSCFAQLLFASHSLRSACILFLSHDCRVLLLALPIIIISHHLLNKLSKLPLACIIFFYFFLQCRAFGTVSSVVPTLPGSRRSQDSCEL